MAKNILVRLTLSTKVFRTLHSFAQILFQPLHCQCLMEFCKASLTFESADEILWCDHSNESSLPELTHGAICFPKFYKMKFGNLVQICLWLDLTLKGFKMKFCGVTIQLKSTERTFLLYCLLRCTRWFWLFGPVIKKKSNANRGLGNFWTSKSLLQWLFQADKCFSCVRHMLSLNFSR